MTTFVPRPQIPGPVRSSSFDDLLPEGVSVCDIRPDGVEFDGDLSPADVAAIKDRLYSTGDADRAERARIRAAVADGAANLAEMLAARMLGDPVPEAVLPE